MRSVVGSVAGKGSEMTRATVLRLLLVLALAAGPSDATADAGGANGESLFLRDCATCHLGRGSLIGVAPLPRLLRDPLRYGETEEVLFTVTKNGTSSAQMPAFGGVLSDDEIRSIVGYIRERRASLRP